MNTSMYDLNVMAQQFDPTTRTRGEEYFQTKKVRLTTITRGHEATFTVLGTYPYRVHLKIANMKDLVATCTCPYFAEGNYCKHIWAAILEAETHDFFEIGNNKSEITWKNKLEKISNDKNKRATWRDQSQDKSSQPQARRSGLYVIDLDGSKFSKKWILRFYVQEHKKRGGLSAIKSISVAHDQIALYADPLDQKALWSFLGMPSTNYSYYYNNKKEFVFLESNLVFPILQELGNVKKLYLQSGEGGIKALHFNNTSLQLKFRLREEENQFCLYANLREEQAPDQIEIPVNESIFYLEPFIVVNDRMYVANFEGYENWFELIRQEGSLSIPKDDIENFLDYYFKTKNAPVIELPEKLQFKASAEASHKTRVFIDTDSQTSKLRCELQFLYGETYVPVSDNRKTVLDLKSRTIYERNPVHENAESIKFLALINEVSPQDDGSFFLSENVLAPFVERAFALGWEVVAFKKIVNQSQSYSAKMSAEMSAGVDWFDLSAKFKFKNGAVLSLPQLLQNLKSGQRFIALADGTTGLLQESWIKKFSMLAQAGELSAEGLRLSKVQALFYGTELLDEKNFSVDEKFKTFQKIIKEINHLKESNPNEKFWGDLRHYQKKGLSWLRLISKHEIGGILADDMGLGKTIQILALLSDTNKAKTLIVAPKSLVYNWLNEAQKFTPHLKFYDHTGAFRHGRKAELRASQVIVTTYQTLRRDADFLKDLKFDYFILDEAHYIKNPDSQAYMACRLINARCKIALTGTPVENSLSDLFSILSVVNPGLVPERVISKYAKETDAEALQVLSHALRPFILRRTKDKVLKDLPAKSEQVLYCELSTSEKQKYNELKDYYWGHLSGAIEEKGFDRSKIDILEALLRLRQASCHLGLLNSNLAKGSSSKFDLLLEQLETVIADGHKALVFSQFTSLLGLLETNLKIKNLRYEYLDGKTIDREARVKNFQENKDISVFLISLKAGGVGLNLTSADYVYILDPWWNPAAETQAIDRAHRIGQTKKVFAYKIIAKDTVEEKILALQETKKNLAKAIISNEKSILKGLKFEDLKELFS